MGSDIGSILRHLDTVEWRLRQPPRVAPPSPVDSLVGHVVQQGLIKGAGALSRDAFGSSRLGSQWARGQLKEAKARAARERAEAERTVILNGLDQVESLVDACSERLPPKVLIRLRRDASKARTAARAETIRRRSLALVGLLRVELQGAAQLPAPQDALFALEQGLRNLIRERLSSGDGNWWKNKIPSDVRVRSEDRAAGRRPLIDFLDFGDYAKVILRRDNWMTHFRHVFLNQDWISFRLGELGPIRNDIAHSRDLSYDSAMKLRVLSKEILDKLE